MKILSYIIYINIFIVVLFVGIFIYPMMTIPSKNELADHYQSISNQLHELNSIVSNFNYSYGIIYIDDENLEYARKDGVNDEDIRRIRELRDKCKIKRNHGNNKQIFYVVKSIGIVNTTTAGYVWCPDLSKINEIQQSIWFKGSNIKINDQWYAVIF